LEVIIPASIINELFLASVFVAIGGRSEHIVEVWEEALRIIRESIGKR